jgi:hypothetical protein
MTVFILQSIFPVGRSVNWSNKKLPKKEEFKHKRFGGPTYTFLEHLSTERLIEDMVLLHAKLVDLGMEYRNNRVSLVDIEETINFDPG